MRSVYIAIAIGFIAIMSLGCIEKQTQFVEAENETLPNQDEFKKLGLYAVPMFESPVIENVVGWKVVFTNKTNLTAIEIVITSGERLAGLAKNINLADQEIATLKEIGCKNILVDAATLKVAAKLANSTVGGAVGAGYEVISATRFVPIPVDFAGVLNCQNSYTDSKYIGDVSVQSRTECGFEKGNYYRLRYLSDINGISLQKIEELNKLLGRENVTLAF